MAYQPAQQWASDTPLPATMTDVYAALKVIANLLARPIWLNPGTGQLRVTVDAAPATLAGVTTVSTVNAVTTLTQIAGFDAKLGLNNSIDRDLWSNSVRKAIT